MAFRRNKKADLTLPCPT